MAFSPTRAALEGFRLVARQPAAFAVWSVILAVYYGVFFYVFGRFTDVGARFQDYTAAAQRGPQFMLAAVLALFKSLALLVLISAPLGMLFIAALKSAIYRAVLRPQDRAFAYLRLGAAEFRMLLLIALVWVGAFALEAGCAAGVWMIVVSTLELGAKVLACTGLILATIVVLVFVGVRLSLAGPGILASGRLDLGRAWKMSVGRFWPLVGMICLGWLLAAGVASVAQACLQPFIAPLMYQGGAGLADLVATIAANPMIYAPLALVAALATTLQTVVMYTPIAAAYRDIADEGKG